jgi:hypothetical protein
MVEQLSLLAAQMRRRATGREALDQAV